MSQNKSVEEVMEEIVQESIDQLSMQGEGYAGFYINLLKAGITKTLQQERQTSQEREREIVEAWTNEGRMPSFHREMKAKLYREWPTLAVAIERLTNPNKD